MKQTILAIIIAILIIPLSAGIMSLYFGKSFVSGFIDGLMADLILFLFVGGIILITGLLDS